MGTMLRRSRRVFFRAEVGGPCPFCGGSFEASVADNAVIHSLPYCAEFGLLSVVDYLAAVRARLVARNAS